MAQPRPDTDTPSPTLEFSAVDGVEGFAQAALDVVATARYDLALSTVDLDRRLFGTEAFVERVREFILQHRRARLRVLVHDPVAAVRNSIRLVEFGRLLSSRIEFREAPPARHGLRDEFLIADTVALLYRSAPDQIEAKYYANAPLVARSQLRSFDAAWEEAAPAREMLSLRL